MKFIVLISVVGILSAQTDKSVADLNWMSGYWVMVKGERITQEYWLPESGNSMIGMSKTVKGKKTIEYEFIVLEQDSTGDIFYRAKPVRQTGASFKLVTLENKKAVFENLLHDFPQRIMYHRISEDSLIAGIEGKVNGKVRSIVYPYRKKE